MTTTVASLLLPAFHAAIIKLLLAACQAEHAFRTKLL